MLLINDNYDIYDFKNMVFIILLMMLFVLYDVLMMTAMFLRI